MEVEASEGKWIPLELKYCERCGGLWLRQVGVEEVYCASCIPQLMEFPTVRKLRRIPGLPVPEEWQVEGRMEQLLGLCAQGGNA